MTVSSSVRRAGPFTSGSGPFAFSFKTFAKADLAVYRGDNATGNETLLVLDSDYTVSLNADQNSSPGGSVTLSIALSSQTLVIADATAATQPADLITAGGWDPDTVESVLDRAIMVAQRTRDQLLRVPRVLESEDALNALPKKVERASKLLGFDSNGQPIATSVGVSTAIVSAFGQTLVDDVDARTARKTLLAPGAFVAQSTAVTLGAGDDGKFYLHSGTYTVNVSANSGLGDGWRTYHKNVNTGIITIDPNLAESVDGLATIQLFPGEECELYSTGAANHTLGLITRNVFNVLDFGLKGDDSTDNTAAFNAMLTTVNNSGAVGTKRIYFPAGTYRFNSKPSDITFGVEILGDGMAQSTLKRNYNGSGIVGMLVFTAGANGSAVRSLGIVAASSTTAGSAIQVLSTAGSAVSFLTFEDLFLSTLGTDTWTNTLHFDGSPKTGAPVGARDICLRNCHVFGAAGFSAVFKSIVGLSIVGGGFYPAGGTNAASGGISVEGTASVDSQYINIDVVTVDDIQLIECLDAQITSPVIGGNITNVSTVERVIVRGRVFGTVQQAWVDSAYVASDSAIGSATVGGPYGFTYLPGGQILQYGRTLVNTGGSTTVTLPLTCPNALLNVTVSADATSSIAVSVDPSTFSTSQFKIANSSGTNVNVFWHAIGY